MRQHRTLAPRGFTLVELLTVIAVIILLIGILVPAVSKVREQARKASTTGAVSSLGKACEAFNTEVGRYPRSSGKNPFESSGSNYLTGAQWLGLELMGGDLSGYVSPTLSNDSNNDGKIDDEDWKAWYGGSRKAARLGPYMPGAPDSLVDGTAYVKLNPDSLDGLSDNKAFGDPSGWTTQWSLPTRPFFVDAFRFPILYYAANKGNRFAVWQTKNNDGIYDPSDNAMWTGVDGAYGRNAVIREGVDLTGGGIPHPIKVLGYEGEDREPLPESFTAYIYDQGVFKSTSTAAGQGKVRPQNADTFLLISAGPDGLFGTKDDIKNFGSGS